MKGEGGILIGVFGTFETLLLFGLGVEKSDIVNRDGKLKTKTTVRLQASRSSSSAAQTLFPFTVQIQTKQ